MLFLFVLSLFYPTQAFVNEYLTPEDHTRYYNFVKSAQNSQTYLIDDSLISTVFGFEAFKLLGKEFPNASKLCTSISKKKPRKDDIFNWLTVVGLLGCKIQLPAKLETKLQGALGKPKFSSVQNAAQAIWALIDAGLVQEADVSFADLGATVEQLMDAGGLVRENTKEKTGSAYKTSQAIVLLIKAFERYPDNQDSYLAVLQKFALAVPALLKTGKKSSGSLVFQGSLTATVSVLMGICDLYTHEPDQYLNRNSMNKIGKYILSNKYVESVTAIRNILLGAQYLATNEIYQPVAVSISNPVLDLSKNDGSGLSVTLVSLNGAHIPADSIIAKRLSSGKNTLAEDLEFHVTSDNVYTIQVRDFIKKVGVYKIEVDLSLGEEAGTLTRFVRATDSITNFKVVMYDFNKRQGAAKKLDEEKVRSVHPKKPNGSFSLSSVREVRVEANLKGTPAEHVIATFSYVGDCGSWQVCEFSVPAAKKKTKLQWRIDLNKSEYKRFLEGVYKLTLHAAGVFISNPISWELGTINVELPIEDEDEKEYEPVNDNTPAWSPKESIAHTFASPPSQPNRFLSIIFTFVVLTPFFGFFILRRKVFGPLQWKYPQGWKQQQNFILFQVSLCALVCLLLSYWVCLNIFQAFYGITIIMGACLFFGFHVLREIARSGGIM